MIMMILIRYFLDLGNSVFESKLLVSATLRITAFRITTPGMMGLFGHSA